MANISQNVQTARGTLEIKISHRKYRQSLGRSGNREPAQKIGMRVEPMIRDGRIAKLKEFSVWKLERRRVERKQQTFCANENGESLFRSS